MAKPGCAWSFEKHINLEDAAPDIMQAMAHKSKIYLKIPQRYSRYATGSISPGEGMGAGSKVIKLYHIASGILSVLLDTSEF